MIIGFNMTFIIQHFLGLPACRGAFTPMRICRAGPG